MRPSRRKALTRQGTACCADFKPDGGGLSGVGDVSNARFRTPPDLGTATTTPGTGGAVLPLPRERMLPVQAFDRRSGRAAQALFVLVHPRRGQVLDAGAGVILPAMASAAEADALRYADSRGVSPFAGSNRWGAARREAADARRLLDPDRARLGPRRGRGDRCAGPCECALHGQARLSNELGRPPNLDDPALLAAAQRIAGAGQARQGGSDPLPRSERSAPVRSVGFSLLRAGSRASRCGCRRSGPPLEPGVQRQRMSKRTS